MVWAHIELLNRFRQYHSLTLWTIRSRAGIDRIDVYNLEMGIVSTGVRYGNHYFALRSETLQMTLDNNFLSEQALKETLREFPTPLLSPEFTEMIGDAIK